MTKEKLESLTKYLGRLRDKLHSPITNKWAHNPVTYKQFLQREIDTVIKKLEAVKLEGTKEK